MTSRPNLSPMPSPDGSAAPGTSPAVTQLRKAMGLPPDQPVPEQKLIQAMNGGLGPDIKRMAMAVGGAMPGSMAAQAPADGSADAAGGATTAPVPGTGPSNNATPPVPTTPDPSQTGGQSEPPTPRGADTGKSGRPMEMAPKMGASSIFGRDREAKPMHGKPEDEEEAMPKSRSMFSRR